MLLIILQILQENAYLGVSYKKLRDRRFPVKFAKFLSTSFFHRTPPVTAPVLLNIKEFWLVHHETKQMKQRVCLSFQSAFFMRLAYFYVTITGDFERFNYFAVKTSFLKQNEIFFKKLEYCFLVERTQYFYTELPCQKPVLRQIERVVQNGPITKNGVLFQYNNALSNVF